MSFSCSPTNNMSCSPFFLLSLLLLSVSILIIFFPYMPCYSSCFQSITFLLLFHFHTIFSFPCDCYSFCPSSTSSFTQSLSTSRLILFVSAILRCLICCYITNYKDFLICLSRQHCLL